MRCNSSAAVCTGWVNCILQWVRGLYWPNLGFFFRHVKVVRLQPLAALLMNLFLASHPFYTLKTVGGRDKHKSGGCHEASTYQGAKTYII